VSFDEEQVRSLVDAISGITKKTQDQIVDFQNQLSAYQRDPEKIFSKTVSNIKQRMHTIDKTINPDIKAPTPMTDGELQADERVPTINMAMLLASDDSLVTWVENTVNKEINNRVSELKSAKERLEQLDAGTFGKETKICLVILVFVILLAVFASVFLKTQVLDPNWQLLLDELRPT